MQDDMRQRGGRRGFEALETRQLMAGDVWADVVRGHLIIQGDAADNQIAVVSGDAPGKVVIVGLEGTHVRLRSDAPPAPPADGANPPAVSSVTVEGVRRDVIVRMDAGDDLVRIDKLQVRGDLSISLGEGRDTLLAGLPAPAARSGSPARIDLRRPPTAAVGVGGTLRVRGGEGDDVVRIAGAGIGGSLVVAADEGDDRVVVGLPPEPRGTQNIETIDDPPSIPPAPPAVTVRHAVKIRLGEGNDQFRLGGLVAKSVEVAAGAGDDLIALSRLSAAAYLEVKGDEGHDAVVLSGVRAGVAAIDLGAGNDQADVVDSAFMALGVRLGQGDDALRLQDVRARWALLSGGLGDDALELKGDNRLGRRRIDDFETLVEPVAPTA